MVLDATLIDLTLRMLCEEIEQRAQRAAAAPREEVKQAASAPAPASERPWQPGYAPAPIPSRPWSPSLRNIDADIV